MKLRYNLLLQRFRNLDLRFEVTLFIILEPTGKRRLFIVESEPVVTRILRTCCKNREISHHARDCVPRINNFSALSFSEHHVSDRQCTTDVVGVIVLRKLITTFNHFNISTGISARTNACERIQL
jgi:hypothetical protein